MRPATLDSRRDSVTHIRIDQAAGIDNNHLVRDTGLQVVGCVLRSSAASPPITVLISRSNARKVSGPQVPSGDAPTPA